MEPVTVTRTIDLDASVDDVWSQLVDDAARPGSGPPPASTSIPAASAVSTSAPRCGRR